MTGAGTADGLRPATEPPEHYRLYRAWWGRPWPVWRDTDRDPDIPALPDIAQYQPSA